MNLARTHTLALAGAILLTATVAAVAVPLVDGANRDGKGGGVEIEVASAAVPPAEGVPDTTAVPATTVPTTTTAPTSAATPGPTPRAPSRSGAPTTAAPAGSAPAPSPTPVPAAPKLAPGQRLNPTSAQVQAARTALHQRIPLFDPTEAQLRTFADAVCTSLDQGRSRAEVESTVRDAVSRIQGASLTAADAAFAVGLMIELRCPGYLP